MVTFYQKSEDLVFEDHEMNKKRSLTTKEKSKFENRGYLKELRTFFFSRDKDTEVTLWNFLVIYLIYSSSKWLETQMLMP